MVGCVGAAQFYQRGALISTILTNQPLVRFHPYTLQVNPLSEHWSNGNLVMFTSFVSGVVFDNGSYMYRELHLTEWVPGFEELEETDETNW